MNKKTPQDVHDYQTLPQSPAVTDEYKGAFKVIKGNVEAGQITSTTAAGLYRGHVDKVRRDENLSQSAEGNKQLAAKKWKPWQERYRDLRAEGMSIGKARELVGAEISASGTWPFVKGARTDTPGRDTLSKWLKEKIADSRRQ